MKRNDQALQGGGFTLVELLVTIAIVIALAALAMVVSRSMIKKGHAAASVNNLRQIGQGMAMLVADGPPGYGNGPNHFPSYSGKDEDWVGYNWADLIGEKLGFVEKGHDEYEWQTAYHETVFQNPGQKRKFDNSSWDSFKSTACYGYNYAGLGQWSSPSHRTEGNNPNLGNATPLNIEFPQTKVVVAETDGDGTADHLVWPYWKDAGVSDMYNGGGHYLFADWHVAWMNKEEVMDNLDKHFRPDRRK